MKKFLLFLAAAVATVSCSKEDLSTSNPDADKNGSTTISIAVGANDDADLKSRVDVSDDGAEGYNVAWNSADKLGAWADGGSIYYNNSFSEFTIESYDEFTSTFSGTIMYGSNASRARFFHPYITGDVIVRNDDTIDSESNGNACNELTLNMSSQESASDLSKMSATTYMMSSWFTPPTSNSDEISETPVMKHLGAAVELKIKCNAAADYILVSATVEGEMIPTEVAVNLQSEVDADYFTVNKTGAITLTASQEAETTDNGNSVFSLPFNSFPFTIENGASITVSATFKGTDDKLYTGSKTITNDGEAINFARATRNKLLFDIAELTEDAPVVELKTIEIVCEDFEAGYDKNDGDKIINDIHLNIKDCSNQGYIQMKANGYFYNTKPLLGLATIEIEMTSGSPSVYAGTSENPLSDALVASNGVYTIPAGSDYFTIKAGSSLIKIESVKFSYTGIESTDTVFTGLDTESITFESDATEAKTVNFEGKYFENATSIEVKNSNEDDFEVVYNNGDSFFTVAPKAANNSDAEYTATIDVTIDGTTHSLAVSQVGANQVVYKSLHICEDNIFDCKSEEVTADIADGVTFTGKGFYVYKNNVATNQDGKAYLYNVTELIGLKEIVIAQTDKFTVCAGDSVNPTTKVEGVLGDDNEYVYTIPSDCKFISLKNEQSFYVNTACIDLVYVSVGETNIPASFTGLNPESLEFESDETDAKEVTIEGSHLDKASITVENSNKADFNVVYTSGTTFTVAPKAANTSNDTAKTAIVTVTVDGAVETLDVAQKFVGASTTVVIYPTDMQKAAGLSETGNPKEVNYGDLSFNFSNMGLYGTPLEYRYYVNSTITIESKSEITSIDFGCSMSASITTGDGTYSNGKWTGNAKKVALKVSKKMETTTPITITYGGGSTEIPSEFTGLDPESIKFEYDVTAAQTVNLVGDNFDGAEISVVNGNTENFEVVYTSGTSFTVAPKATNTSDAVYEATITVTVDGTEHELAVSQKYEGQAAAVEALYASFKSSDLGTYVTSATVSTDYPSITYIEIADAASYNGSNEGKIQWRSKKGKIYNTQAISNLSKVVVKGDIGFLKVSSGNSSQPSTAINGNETSEGTEFEIPSGDTYFLISNATGTTYSGDVEIYTK